MNADDDWKTPPLSAPRFVGVGRIYRDAETGLYVGLAVIRGVQYDIKATIHERHGRKEFALEHFESDGDAL